MSEKNMLIKPIAAAVGVAFASSLAISTTAIAADNPFVATDLSSGYLLAGDGDGEEGKCGAKGEEGKCGAKGEEGKCGEGKCGEDKAKEGSCGEDKAKEGSCGEDHAKEGGE